MKIAKSALRLILGNASFLALFPGFFFYHSAVGSGYFPPVLGGYFSPVALITIVFLGFFYVGVLLHNRREFTPTDLWFFLFLGFFILIVVFNYIGRSDGDVTTHHATAILHLLTCFIVFRIARFDAAVFRRMLLASVLGMACVIIFFSDDGSFYLKQSGIGDTDDIATYQGFARSFIFAAVVLVAFTEKFSRRFLLYAVCLPSLYLSIARSEFFGFIFFAFVFELVSSKRSIFALGIAAVVAISFYLSLNLFSEILPENRVLMLLLDQQGDTSGGARLDFTSQAITTIMNNPILGAYASYVEDFSSGSYAHNILSAWVDLGAIGFFLLVGALIAPAVFLLKVGRTKANRTPEFRHAFSLLLLTIFLLVTAKDFTYMLTGAALGSAAMYRSQYRRSRTAARMVAHQQGLAISSANLAR
ncbi:hypothetical protein ACSFBI_33345 [Variovorax sp. RB3P1]|uniref:hypothetical protein n=1 Tax=Variovorax sp. RB3P1 TaxID=3443732 RepID=UPI003F46B5A4